MTAEFTADISAEVPAYAISEQARRIWGIVPIARTAKVLLTEGIVLARHRELERAIALFTQALSLTITDPAIRLKSHYHRGCALSGVSRYGEAIADFTQVIQFGESEGFSNYSESQAFAAVPATKLTELYIHRGNAYRHAGHYQLAAADLESGVARSGGSAQSYGARGLLRLDQGNFEGAIADFSKALEVHPTFVQCHLWRGFARLHSDDYPLAIDDLSCAIQAIPGCAEAYNHRGIARFYLNNFGGALSDFDQAIQINPEFVQAYNNRGNLRQLLGEPVAAAVDYDRAIALNPHLSELYFNRAAAISTASHLTLTGEIHPHNALAEIAADYEQADYEQADYEQAGYEQAGYEQAGYEQAGYEQAGYEQIGYKQTDYKQANYRKTARSQTHSLSSAAQYRHRAQIRFQQGDLSAAVADYTCALALSPSAYAYAHRGIAYLALGQIESAHSDLNAAISLTPDYSAPYGDRAYLRFKANDLTGAIADTNYALALACINTEHSPTHPRIQKLYAMRCLIHFCMQDKHQALQDFEQLIAIFQKQTADTSNRASALVGRLS
jgi:tetratricopeptide (TPR) repeat protein